VWQSPDPILNEYMSGQTNGGVFNPKNLNMFGYTYNNPVNLVDPDGNNPKIVGDFVLNLAISYATEGKLSWSAVKGAAIQTVKDAVNPMATVNKIKKLTKIAGKISGYSKHGIHQAVGRDGGKGVGVKHILDAVKKPKKVVSQTGGRTRYQGKKATVVLNKDGKVITTFGSSRSKVKGVTPRKTGGGKAQRKANSLGFSYLPERIK